MYLSVFSFPLPVDTSVIHGKHFTQKSGPATTVITNITLVNDFVIFSVLKVRKLASAVNHITIKQ